ncbi:4-hydroxy-tetrahydrodipicolinate synthase [Carboxylicivirga sediminis]|uniref:4-hydroxy-tetrahydrodipicolinate synthase n=1 Tax=Carboxylicivirga sediminis TaxID=2006564 RepID=A0A941F753_9BACT|nr:4-hydroxy-tetrahydrodipicolinate synthase [Carboxylicivirga sediminis]MBR8537832.1 4-hydroxy-tetrahydrodipicolinate synthase [Carboxylicivirga sediminis]
MISAQQLKGTGVALVTPFNEHKQVDHTALTKLVNFVIEGGVNFLVALGTTAETATLNDKERLEVVKTIKKANDSRVPIIMGMGGNNTSQLTDTINKTDFDGIDAILSVTPFYNKPTQEGLYQHYKTIAEASPVPIILYNVPSRTGCNLDASTCLQLANDFDNIIAVKEASGDLLQVMDIIKYKPDDFAVLSGDDALTLPILGLGGDGVISVVANGYPKAFSQMVQAAHNDNYIKARRLHYGLTDIIKNLFIESNPAGIKAILEMREIIDNQLRLPLVPLTEQTYDTLKAQFKAFQAEFWNAF